MKILTLLISILAFFMPMVTGLITEESWLWFYICIPLVLIASFIVVCLPGVPGKERRTPSPVENEEIFDHLFITKTQKTFITLRKGGSLKEN
jgi:hypothetical protein